MKQSWMSLGLALFAGPLFGETSVERKMTGPAGEQWTVLRTPDERFANLPGYPFAPHYVDVLGGLRMHYVDEGEGTETFLCLHGEPSWSYLYRKMIPILAQKGRVIAPDLIGFGKSDKLSEKADYTYAMHYQALEELVQKLDLKNVTLVCQDWGGLLGLPLATRNDARFARLVIMNTGLPARDTLKEGETTFPVGPAFMAWRAFAASVKDMDIGRILEQATETKLTPEILAAYNAPFPDARFKAGAHQFPLLVPITPDDPAVPYMAGSRNALKNWEKPALVLFSDGDPITKGGDVRFRKLIPSASREPEIVIKGGGHFLQEDKGEEIADQIVAFVGRRPLP